MIPATNRHHFLGCAWIMLMSGVASAQQDSVDPAQLLVAAANGYQANLDSFPHISARYTIGAGSAKSLNDAAAGRLAPNSRTALASWVRDKGDMVFRLEEDAATKKILDKPPQTTKLPGGLMAGPLVPFISGDMLSDGAYSIDATPRYRAANVMDGGTRKSVSEDFLLTPLRINTHDDFAELARAANRGILRFKVDLVVVGDSKLIRAAFKKQTGQSLIYTLDPSRGYLPVQIESSFPNDPTDTSIGYTVVPSIRACSGGRWFPERVVTFLMQKPPGGLARVYQLTEFDADTRPSRDAFRLTLPAGTIISRLGEPREYFVTKQLERIGPKDLPQIYKMTQQARQKSMMDTAIRTPVSQSWYWYMAGGIGVAAAISTYFIRRRRFQRGTRHAHAS